MKLAKFIFASLPLIVDYYTEKYRQEDYHRTLLELEASLGVPQIQTYDFIVIGAGTGGCVVATRLAQRGLYSVLLLEAGDDPPPTTSVPTYQLSGHPAIKTCTEQIGRAHV